jgi:hypothetical protein
LAADPKAAFDQLSMRSWVAGFLSGISTAGLFAPDNALFRLQKTDVDATIGWIDQYCAAHPLETVHTAAGVLWTELIMK